MEINAYTLPGCSSCRTLIELFERANVSYTEIVVKEDIKLEEFRQIYSTVSAFPFVVIDGESVGGLVETVKLFIDKGLVSSSKRKKNVIRTS